MCHLEAHPTDLVKSSVYFCFSFINEVSQRHIASELELALNELKQGYVRRVLRNVK